MDWFLVTNSELCTLELPQLKTLKSYTQQAQFRIVWMVKRAPFPAASLASSSACWCCFTLFLSTDKDSIRGFLLYKRAELFSLLVAVQDRICSIISPVPFRLSLIPSWPTTSSSHPLWFLFYVSIPLRPSLWRLRLWSWCLLFTSSPSSSTLFVLYPCCTREFLPRILGFPTPSVFCKLARIGFTDCKSLNKWFMARLTEGDNIEEICRQNILSVSMLIDYCTLPYSASQTIPSTHIFITTPAQYCISVAWTLLPRPH